MGPMNAENKQQHIMYVARSAVGINYRFLDVDLAYIILFIAIR